MEHVFANITSPKSAIALQVGRKIAPCDRALRDVVYEDIWKYD